ncbi:hypothetical protein [Hymenobacter ruricola]|uniref:Lipoprotein n=1 Tax=Hymenobacter ruricola TaxID=2791023 RepID=A0ABS0I8Z5_9BACT|nr:hypothetical protein [Hymenobacter ruricola]MBF9223153.1 hypothetical protein [Hymenobacter ruricola]
MRRCFVVAGLLLLLSGCDQKTAQRQETVAQAPVYPAVADVPAAPLAAPDTALPYRPLPGSFDSVQAPLQVRINNADYRVQVSARADSAQPLRYVAPPNEFLDGSSEDSTQRQALTGVEVVYTFRLLRANGQPQFVRQLKKSDFKAAVGEELAVEADVSVPVFSGYLPAFQALAFEISFYPPESDAGGQVLVLLDATTGKVLHRELARWTDGCNSATVLSADGRTLLTSCEILQANGHVVNLEKANRTAHRTIAGTLLVNDQTVLVVYGPGYDNHGREVPLKGPNATLMDTNGRVLKSFSLESIDGGLGSQMLARYLGSTQTHYLYDEAHGRLGVVPRSHPTGLRVLKLRQLPVFRAPQRPSEIELSFSTETGSEATFYIDTTSQQVRYSLHKPAY